MSIPADTIAKARAISFESEITRRGIKLRKQGAELVGPCARCGGVDRFSINTRKQVFNCRGCSVGGDVIALVQHIDSCGFTTAVETLTGERPRPPAVTSLSTTEHTPDEYEAEQHRKAAWLWSLRRPIKGSPAERFL